ncbi:MAG: hypothetical protein K6F29_04510 [Bacteroidales bacterium]|jgi:hypothetical protein|nr:hypothetical protein [Bacteroidales bacterium]MBQ4478192.1 hypothetical protein [Bacteroidales bacterium]MCR5554778.1 hypothetical protein [Bacteroidales bacterium]
MKNFKVFIAVVALGLLAACANKENEPKIYTVDELSSIMGQLVDSTINVQGVAKHICAVSGRKLMLGSDSSEETITVFTKDGNAPFDKETIDKHYTINGIVKVMLVVDEDYLNQWEQQVLQDTTQEGHVCVTEQQGVDINSEENPQLQQIKAYREQIAQNGGQPLTFYYIECQDYSISE